MFNKVKKSVKFGEHNLIIETGEIGRQADGAVMVSYGDTVVFVTAVGNKIALRNIFFDTGKSKLRPTSNTEIDRLVKLMKDVPTLKIEISGHTDNTGSVKLNNSLSQDRAQAVVNYLKAKGIATSRMTAMGYGPSKPSASNKTSDGRQQNRRTEFEIKGN